jgi:putative transposase
MSSRRQHSSRFKSQVALEAIRNQRTIAEIASECGIHPSQVNKWKKHVLDELPSIFSNSHERGRRDNEKLQAELYQQIGQLKVELDWVKKKAGMLS